MGVPAIFVQIIDSHRSPRVGVARSRALPGQPAGEPALGCDVRRQQAGLCGRGPEGVYGEGEGVHGEGEAIVWEPSLLQHFQEVLTVDLSMSLIMLAFTALLALCARASSQSSNANGGDGATNLRVEYLTAPLSIDTPLPRFSFVATCGEPSWCPRGTKIGSVHITVTALTTGASVWDAQLQTPQTSQIEYAGAALLSNTDYAWTASWSRNGTLDGSATAMNTSTFSTALFNESDWHDAEWLGTADQRLLRRSLDIPFQRKIVRARAFVATPGCHALQIDTGVGFIPVGDQFGICPWTDFGKSRKTVM